jgi:dUTP pyrophosphatase
MQIKLTDLAKELMANGITDQSLVYEVGTPPLVSFVPSKGTPASAGFDLKACIDKPKQIVFGETLLVPCGFHLHIKDPNIVGKLYVRSSVGTKLGLVLANGTGIVDSDYQDEWMLALRCYRREEKQLDLFSQDEEQPKFVTIYPAQRLAQVVFTPVVHPMFYHVEEFTESSDRLGGFGSTDLTGLGKCSKHILPNDDKNYEG